MPSIPKLLPLGIAAVLLAGCSGGAVAGGLGATPSGPATRPAVGGSAPGGAATPTAVAAVPGACTLVTQSDLVAVTKDTVTLEFVGTPAEQSGTDLLGGGTSTCRLGVRSSWSDESGTATVDGAVTVRIQATGAARYFPNSDGEPVTGVGDEAFSRDRQLYVRLNSGVLILDVAISNPADDQRAMQIGWAKALALIAVGRV
jgi:hypothetical protein